MSLIKGSEYNIDYTLRFDGGCAPTNPGPCAGAYVIYDNKGKILAQGGEYTDSGTNNYGEYCGLIYGLRKCKELDIDNIHIEGDSLLVISHVTKKWKIRSENLLPLLSEVNDLLKSFSHIYLKHILREFNSYADELCNKILKSRKSI
jgi:ribonuclease HI